MSVTTTGVNGATIPAYNASLQYAGGSVQHDLISFVVNADGGVTYVEQVVNWVGTTQVDFNQIITTVITPDTLGLMAWAREQGIHRGEQVPITSPLDAYLVNDLYAQGRITDAELQNQVGGQTWFGNGTAGVQYLSPTDRYSVTGGSTTAVMDASNNATYTKAATTAGTTTTGTTGNDSFESTVSNQNFDGLAGFDSIMFNGSRASHVITKTTAGYSVSSTSDGSDTIANIEQLKFSDTTITVGTAGTAATAHGAVDVASAIATQMAVVYLGRPADHALLKTLATLDAGGQPNAAALSYIHAIAVQDGAFKSTDTSADIVTHTFNNILGFLPSAYEQKEWGQYIDSGFLTAETAPWVIFQSYLGATNVPAIYQQPTQARFVAAQTFSDYIVTDAQEAALSSLGSAYSNAARAWLAPVDSINHAAAKMGALIADIDTVTLTGIAPVDIG